MSRAYERLGPRDLGQRFGRPVAFYSDKHSIFRVAKDGSSGRTGGVTQFGRPLQEFNIDIICANTPQAKGRVERMNGTLQDRLVGNCDCGTSRPWTRPTSSHRRSWRTAAPDRRWRDCREQAFGRRSGGDPGVAGEA